LCGVAAGEVGNLDAIGNEHHLARAPAEGDGDVRTAPHHHGVGGTHTEPLEPATQGHHGARAALGAQRLGDEVSGIDDERLTAQAGGQHQRGMLAQQPQRVGAASHRQGAPESGRKREARLPPFGQMARQPARAVFHGRGAPPAEKAYARHEYSSRLAA
jgi:hypothetical protein